MRITEYNKTRPDEEEGIRYKDDDQRFEEQYTLKLKTTTEYRITLEIEPIQHVSYVKMGGRKTDDESLILVNQTGERRTLSFFWSTKGIRPTQRAYRYIYPCAVKFRMYSELKFNLQMKVYSRKNVASYNTGRIFSHLYLDCKVGVGPKNYTYLKSAEYHAETVNSN